MTSQFNKLTPAEAERLFMLAEEAGEIVQAVGKILRHGNGSFNPDNRSAGTNRQQLSEEIGEFIAIVDILLKEGDLDSVHLKQTRLTAWDKKHRYTHHQPDSVKEGEPA